MDHSPSIITQVTRDEEENAARRDEGEIGRKSFAATFCVCVQLRMTPDRTAVCVRVCVSARKHDL